MIASEYIQLLRLENAFFRENPPAIQAEQIAKINEIQQQLRWNGADPTLWDYGNGTVVATAQTGNATTTTFDLGGYRNFFVKGALIRIVTTVGATPTATYQIQGSADGTNWVPAKYGDYLSPGTIVTTTFAIVAAGTNIKYVPPGQSFRYLSVAVTSNTNVTNTIDISPIG